MVNESGFATLGYRCPTTRLSTSSGQVVGASPHAVQVLRIPYFQVSLTWYFRRFYKVNPLIGDICVELRHSYISYCRYHIILHFQNFPYLNKSVRKFFVYWNKATNVLNQFMWLFYFSKFLIVCTCFSWQLSVCFKMFLLISGKQFFLSKMHLSKMIFVFHEFKV